MRRAWGIVLAVSLGLVGCDTIGKGVLPVTGDGNPDTQTPGPGNAPNAADQAELAQMLRDLLAAQQARQQVNLTSGALISNNVGGILSNNGSALTKNAPLISNGAGSLISNGGGTYRVAVSLETAPTEHVALPDGNHFYRFGRPGDPLVESFVTRTGNTAGGFEIPDADVLVHSKMTVTMGDPDLSDLSKPVTNAYHITVLKSPVLTDYVSDVRITAPALGGQTLTYVESATYRVGALPVAAEATHSAFATFTVAGQAMSLPTSGEERIQMGESYFALSYKTINGQGEGTGTWTAPQRSAWPLTYTYEFDKNVARMVVSLPKDRKLTLKIKPGMLVESGVVNDLGGEVLATLVKRDDGRAVARFPNGDEIILFD